MNPKSSRRDQFCSILFDFIIGSLFVFFFSTMQVNSWAETPISEARLVS
jgi:hypothetical protein